MFRLRNIIFIVLMLALAACTGQEVTPVTQQEFPSYLAENYPNLSSDDTQLAEELLSDANQRAKDRDESFEQGNCTPKGVENNPENLPDPDIALTFHCEEAVVFDPTPITAWFMLEGLDGMIMHHQSFDQKYYPVMAALRPLADGVEGPWVVYQFHYEAPVE